METRRHLVAGTDFSEASKQALELAIVLGVAIAAPITLVHVCELGDEGDDERQLLHCHQRLSRLVAEQQRRGAAITGVLRSGRPWEKLDNVAVEVGASLIVIGRHGAGRGARAEIGSVAEHLVRVASRPVLTVTCDFSRLDSETTQTNHMPRKNG